MKSGIYLLKFENGDTYVGKSVDIENRWEQHYNTLMRGNAAEKMQNAFIRYGTPIAKILQYCHTDHIGILESYYVRKLQPTLNSAKTAPIDELTYQTIDAAGEKLLSYSTAELIHTISKYDTEFENLEDEIIELKKEIDRLKVKRTKEELKTELGMRLKDTKDRLNYYEVLAKKCVNYIKLPWYKKLFNKKPV